MHTCIRSACRICQGWHKKTVNRISLLTGLQLPMSFPYPLPPVEERLFLRHLYSLDFRTFLQQVVVSGTWFNQEEEAISCYCIIIWYVVVLIAIFACIRHDPISILKLAPAISEHTHILCFRLGIHWHPSTT